MSRVSKNYYERLFDKEIIENGLPMIRIYMAKNRITMKQLCECLGCSRMTVYNYINGKMNPSLEFFLAMCAVVGCLDVPLSQLFTADVDLKLEEFETKRKEVLKRDFEKKTKLNEKELENTKALLATN